MTQETNKPLYQQLNEQRTQGYWHQFGYKEKSTFLEVEKGTIAEFKFGVSKAEQAEDITNAQYTALAVNNLAEIAEALESLISELETKGATGKLIEKAKEALNKIS